MNKRLNTPENFWSRTAQVGDCLVWTGYRNKLGYGSVMWHGRTQLTHRVAMVLYGCPDPGQLKVCHHCDNPACLTREHLFVGTDRTNSDDKVAKNRQHRPIAGVNANTALTADQVRALRTFVWDGVADIKSLGPVLGVSQSVVWHAATYRTWPNLRLRP